MKFTVTVEEHISKSVTVDASNMDEAISKAEGMYRRGELVLGGESSVTRKLMEVVGPDGEATDWFEF